MIKFYIQNHNNADIKFINVIELTKTKEDNKLTLCTVEECDEINSHVINLINEKK